MTNGLTGRYTEALEDYFAGAGEAALLRAYQLGREAVESGMGVLELAAIHQEALVGVLLRMLAPEENARIARFASQFFVEALGPIEMSQRSAQEANAILRGLNAELEERVQARTRELEKALRELTLTQRQVTEHERMERLKDEFIALVSHELRTPMTSVHGSLDLIQSGLAGEVPSDVKRLIEIAWRNSQHLVRLVSGILDIEKIASGRLTFNNRKLELLPLVDQAVESNRPFASRFGVRYVVNARAPNAWVNADPDRLLQILTNLLSNAAKFSPPGEFVTVDVERVAGRVRVGVSDRGPGIAPEFRARIFQKFASSTPAGLPQRGGTGLGLSIAKALTEAMGGEIDFDSEPGSGTTFHVDFPETEAAPLAVPQPEEAACRNPR